MPHEETALTLHDIVSVLKTNYPDCFVYLDNQDHFVIAKSQPKWLFALFAESITQNFLSILTDSEHNSNRISKLFHKDLVFDKDNHAGINRICRYTYDMMIKPDEHVIDDEEKHLQALIYRCAFLKNEYEKQKKETAKKEKIKVKGGAINECIKRDLNKIDELKAEKEILAEEIKQKLIKEIGYKLVRQCFLGDNGIEILRSVDAIRFLTSALLMAINYRSDFAEKTSTAELDVLSRRIREYLLEEDGAKESETDKFTRQMDAIYKKLLPYLQAKQSVSDRDSGFIGREWLVDECEEWRHNRRSRALLLYGPPGFGKTTFVDHYSRNNPSFLSVFFCSWNNKTKCTASQIILTTAYQLAENLPLYRSKLVDLCMNAPKDHSGKDLMEELMAGPDGVSALFRLLITEPLSQCELPDDDERYVILVDALNEMDHKELSAFSLAFEQEFSILPDRLCFLFTSQDTNDVTQLFSYIQCETLSTSREENEQDIREYTEKNLRSDAVEESKRCELIDLICERSEGVFLYASLVVQEINNGTWNISDSARDSLPGNLSFAVLKYISRIASREDEFGDQYRLMISMICASPEPLPLNHMMEGLHLSMGETEDRLSKLNPFISRTENNGEEVVSLSYHYFYLWFTNRTLSHSYYCPVVDGAIRLAEVFGSYYENKDYENMSLYLLRNFLTILELCGNQKGSERNRVIDDESFLHFAVKKLFDLGFINESIQLCSKIVENAKRCHSKGMYITIASIRMRMGLHYINQGKMKEALSELQECEKVLPFIQEHYSLKTSVYTNTAWAAREDNQLALAESYLEKAKKTAVHMDFDYFSEEVRGDINYTEGGILYKKYNRAEDPEERSSLFIACKDVLERSIRIWQTLGNNDDLLLQISFSNMILAWLYLKNGDYRQSYELFREILAVREEIFKNNPDNQYIAKALGNIANICLIMADFERDTSYLQEAIKACDRAISIYIKLSGTKITDYNAAVAMIRKADILTRLDDIPQAVQTYLEAREIMISYGQSKAGYVKEIDEKLDAIDGYRQK